MSGKLLKALQKGKEKNASILVQRGCSPSLKNIRRNTSEMSDIEHQYLHMHFLQWLDAEELLDIVEEKFGEQNFRV